MNHNLLDDERKDMRLLFLILTLFFSTQIPNAFLQAQEEKHIVVVIPSFNNSVWYQNNLESVFSQQYENYHVYYTDDCSTDRTAELVEHYLQEHNLENRCTLIKNKSRRGALHNLYSMIHRCKSTDIVITLDGDDQLAHNLVLARINEIYSTEDVWLTYGQFQLQSNRQKGWCTPYAAHIIAQNKFRSVANAPSHLRTFYAGLFHKIAIKDLLTHNGFYRMTWDNAIMFPMIEMAGTRHRCIDEILYIYNDITPLNDHKISRQLQTYLAKIIREEKPYTLLETLFTTNKAPSAEVLIFSTRGTEKLESTITSVKKYLTGYTKIIVLYEAQLDKTRQISESIKKQYPEITFISLTPRIRTGSKQNPITPALSSLDSKYTYLLTDTIMLTDTLSLESCISALEKTNAHVFHCLLGAHTQNPDIPRSIEEKPHLTEVFPGIFAWFCKLGNARWSCASTLTGALYKTETLLHEIPPLLCRTVEEFEAHWNNRTNLEEAVGLCFADSKIEYQKGRE
jgi:glycosyltransferase involved in cell wall biosynthesis